MREILPLLAFCLLMASAAYAAGIDTSGNNSLPFNIRGNEVMTLSSGGLNIDVGTTAQNPSTALTVNGYADVKGPAVTGAACSPKGAIGTDTTGAALSCINGVWGANGGLVNTIKTCQLGQTYTAATDIVVNAYCGTNGGVQLDAYINGTMVLHGSVYNNATVPETILVPAGASWNFTISGGSCNKWAGCTYIPFK